MNSSFVKLLRARLGMSQEKFAFACGLSTPSIRNYESGQRLSEAAIEKIKTCAAAHGLADLLIDAGETRLPGVTQILEPTTTRIRVQQAPHASDLTDKLHDRVDQILASGNSELIAIVEGVLQLAARSLQK